MSSIYCIAQVIDKYHLSQKHWYSLWLLDEKKRITLEMAQSLPLDFGHLVGLTLNSDGSASMESLNSAATQLPPIITPLRHQAGFKEVINLSVGVRKALVEAATAPTRPDYPLKLEALQALKS